MAVTSFQDLPLADRDRAWDGDAAEKRVRSWAGADDERHVDAHAEVAQQVVERGRAEDAEDGPQERHGRFLVAWSGSTGSR